MFGLISEKIYLDASIFRNHILRHLKLHQLFSLLAVNNSWNKAVTHEIRARTNCTTLITWHPSFSSHFNSTRDGSYFALPSEGHSALRTYSGGQNNDGIYASFWPGKCKKWNENRSNDPNYCHQSISHYHSPDKDQLTEQNIPRSELHIYNLDINAINNRFEKTKDSNKRWALDNNCSDLAFNLLVSGGIYDKIKFQPYGWITRYYVGIVGMIPAAAIVLDLATYLHPWDDEWDWHVVKSYTNDFFNMPLEGIYNNILSHFFITTLPHGIISSITSALYSTYCVSKKKYNLDIKTKISIILKEALFGFLIGSIFATIFDFLQILGFLTGIIPDHRIPNSYISSLILFNFSKYIFPKFIINFLFCNSNFAPMSSFFIMLELLLLLTPIITSKLFVDNKLTPKYINNQLMNFSKKNMGNSFPKYNKLTSGEIITQHNIFNKKLNDSTKGNIAGNNTSYIKLKK